MMGAAQNHRPAASGSADVDEAAAYLVEVIREVRPQVLVTYDPDGGYGHPDHIQAHRVAMRAAELAAEPAFRPRPRRAARRSPRSTGTACRARWPRRASPGCAPPAAGPLPGHRRRRRRTGCGGRRRDHRGDRRRGVRGGKAAAMRAHATQIAVDGPFFALSNDLGQPLFATEYYQLVQGEPGRTAGDARARPLRGGDAAMSAASAAGTAQARTGLAWLGPVARSPAGSPPTSASPCSARWSASRARWSKAAWFPGGLLLALLAAAGLFYGGAACSPAPSSACWRRPWAGCSRSSCCSASAARRATSSSAPGSGRYVFMLGGMARRCDVCHHVAARRNRAATRPTWHSDVRRRPARHRSDRACAAARVGARGLIMPVRSADASVPVRGGGQYGGARRRAARGRASSKNGRRSQPGEPALSRETDSSSSGPQGRGGAAYPSGTPPYGSRQYPSLHPPQDAPDETRSRGRRAAAGRSPRPRPR